MTHTETSSTPPPSADRMSHRAKAKQLDVSPKTIDRWTEAGRLPPPEYINGRKYHRADAEPRPDEGRLRRDPPRRRGK
jgi:hypothetical protein